MLDNKARTQAEVRLERRKRDENLAPILPGACHQARNLRFSHKARTSSVLARLDWTWHRVVGRVHISREKSPLDSEETESLCYLSRNRKIETKIC